MKTRNLRTFGAILAIFAVVFIGCPASDDSKGTLTNLSGEITITPATATIGETLTANYSGSETVSYQWKNGLNNVGANSNTFTLNEAGSYTVTVSAKGYNSKTSAPVVVTAPFTSITDF
jgi:hypothetical protein